MDPAKPTKKELEKEVEARRVFRAQFLCWTILARFPTIEESLKISNPVFFGRGKSVN
jgi:hypothetical protein